TAKEAAGLAADAGRAGTDAIMVGGSTGVTQDKVDGTVLAIKEAIHVPVILFPASAANLSPHADALYFMSLLNSRDPRLIVGEQRLASRWSWAVASAPRKMRRASPRPGPMSSSRGRSSRWPARAMPCAGSSKR